MTQDEALNILKTGKSVFLTGEPGSGKTHTINRYVKYLREHKILPAVTASTGIAATHIGGMTIHSWSGIGISTELSKNDLAVITGRSKVQKRVQGAKALIIDEVSMLASTTLGMVDMVCREIRENPAPFGGLQVVLVGDFFQLPPISRDGGRAPFAYESDAWQELNPEVCYLSEQYRQDDQEFLSLLSAIRQGNCGERERALVAGRLCGAKNLPESIPRFFPYNADVDRLNNEKLTKLPEKPTSFFMEAHGPRPLVEALKKSCLSPEVLELKAGAAVMFTKNSRDGKFVNGTLGTVIKFDRESGYPIVASRNGRKIFAEPMEWTVEEGGKVRARVAQIPLRLAWAITVHKSQGMSMDEAAMDLSHAFEYGQGYVALSRVRRLSGLYLFGVNDRAFEVHPEVLSHDRNFREESEEAARRFRALGENELSEEHAIFIRACGGTLSPKVNHVFRADLSTHDITLELARKNLSLCEIAQERGLKVGTVIHHLEKLVLARRLDPHRELLHLKPEQPRFQKIKTAFEIVYAKEKKMLLAPVREALGDDFTFEELRLARLFL